MVRSSLIWDQYHWSAAAITTTKGLSEEPVIAVKAELRRVTNQALSFTGRSQPGNNSVL
ncbi:hypothetical protein YC2023_006299 [Brassica napus]